MTSHWLALTLALAGAAFALGRWLNARGAQHLARSVPAPAVRRIARLEDAHVDEPSQADARALASVVREVKLELQNSELRLMLDTVDQGFLTVDLDGQVLPERSKILERWFGALPRSLTIGEVFGKMNPSASTWVRGALQQLAAGLLPYEVAIDQFPRRLTRPGQYLDVAYYPVREGDALKRLVVVLTDVTEGVERQRAIGEQHDFSMLVERFARDEPGFREFWLEATSLFDGVIASLRASTRSEQTLRDLHTLKGTLGFLGLSHLATACHTLEDALLSDRKATDEIEALAAGWESVAGRMAPLLGARGDGIELSLADHEDLLRTARGVAGAGELATKLARLKLRPLKSRLEWAGEHLTRVAKRLGKTPPLVTIRDHDVRLPPQLLASFWPAFTHALNNAADHGIEPDATRRALGKPVPAPIRLEASVSNDTLVLELADSGPGIDFEALRSVRLPASKEAPAPLELLFADGTSTKEQSTEVSGRGTGMAALRKVVTDLRGEVDVSSTAGAGTTLRFRLPTAPSSSSERSGERSVARGGPPQ